jgi:hypothetical protein
LSNQQSILATAESLRDNPPPIPAFLFQQPDGNPGHLLGYECIEIDQTRIWEPGDHADTLREQLDKSLIVSVDHNFVPSDEILSPHSLVSSPVTDESGNIIGWTEGPMQVCFDRQKRSNGLHLATIEVRSTSGKVYSYSWAFETAE